MGDNIVGSTGIELARAVELGIVVGKNLDDYEHRSFTELSLPLARNKLHDEVWVLKQGFYAI
jgi:hypothetical protein